MVGTKHSDGGFLVCSVVPSIQNSRPAQRRVRPKQGGAVLGRCVDAVYYVRPEYVCVLYQGLAVCSPLDPCAHVAAALNGCWLPPPLCPSDVDAPRVPRLEA